MLQKLRNEDVNRIKLALCKRNNILCKQMACEESTLVKGVFYWNALRKEEKERLLNEIGRSLAPILVDRLSILSPSGNTPTEFTTVNQEQAKTKFKKEKKPLAEIDSQTADVEQRSREERDPSLLTAFDSILDWKGGSQSKPSHNFVRLVLRVLNEKASKDLLADLSSCLLVTKFFSEQLFQGQKAVVNYTLLDELGLAILEASVSGIASQSTQENDGRHQVFSASDKAQAEGTHQHDGRPSSKLIAEKTLKSGRLVEEVEGSLFAFAIMFENRLLEMVNYHEVFFGANQGKMFNMIPYMRPESDQYDPDKVICRFIKPLTQKGTGKGKLTNDHTRFFKIRRAIRRIQPDRTIDNKTDFIKFHALAYLNGYNYQIAAPDDSILASRISKELQDFRHNINSQKKPNQKNYSGHSYHYNNMHGYGGHNMRHFNPQFSSFLANHYQNKGGYSLNYMQHRGRDHNASSR